MGDWVEDVLGTVIEVKYGKDHKPLASGNIPVYGSGGIMRYVSDSIYNDESILIPRKGSLILIILRIMNLMSLINSPSLKITRINDQILFFS